MQPSETIPAFVSWPGAPFTESLVRKALEAVSLDVSIISSIPSSFSSLIQWSTYDDMDHELTHIDHEHVLSSSYTIRKALIRKHFLSHCIHSYLTKHETSPLKQALPRTWEIDISFADELDEMWTDELWELGAELQDPNIWWIIKPGMADRGMGIRLFNSKESLQTIFEEFDEDSEDEEDDGSTAVVTSQLRHFVIQEYISNPLLLDPSEMPIHGNTRPSELQGHKFHLRAYCVSSGALTLYLNSRILALFSAVPYRTPVLKENSGRDQDSAIDLGPHLTNTSLQTHRGEEGVRLLDELVGCHTLSGQGKGLELTEADVNCIIDQMADILAETFKAALQNPIHFQPQANAFELYGIDFLVTHHPSDQGLRSPFQLKLLEVNAEPAIELTGPRLSWILEDLFVAIGKVCVEPFFAKENQRAVETWPVGETRHGLRKCLDVEVRGPGGC